MRGKRSDKHAISTCFMERSFLLRISVFFGTAVVLLLVAAGFPWRGVPQIYGSGLLWVLGFILAFISSYVCVLLLLRGRWIKAALHATLPLLMLGALANAANAQRAEFGIFVGMDYATDELVDAGTRKGIPLDFEFAIKNFTIDYYPFVYGLCDSTPQRVKVVDTATVKNGTLSFPKHGITVPDAGLPTEPDKPQLLEALPKGKAIVLLDPKEKRYQAQMSVERDGAMQSYFLEINHPVDVGPWRFYLLSHGEQKGRPFVYLLAKREPGSPYFKAAFIWAIISIFVWSFSPRKKAKQPSS